MEKSKSFDHVSKSIVETLEHVTIQFLKYIHETPEVKLDNISIDFPNKRITAHYLAENAYQTTKIKWHNYTTYVILELYSPSQPKPNESEGVASSDSGCGLI
jgi:hypothetical protein